MTNIFIYPLRIHIEDTDYGGVVYHSNYLNFFERARSEWAEELGFGSAWQRQQGIYFPVHTATIQFMTPARLHEKVEVVSKIINLKTASMVFDQCLRLTSNPDKILCRAEIKIACVDTEFKPRGIPDEPPFALIRRMIS